MERIYDEKGNWWAIEIVDSKETWVMHNYKGRSIRKYGPDGYDAEGYDNRGFNRDGICKWTNTRYGRNGKDVEGYNKHGFKDGLNRHGFRESDLLHSETLDIFDSDGYNFYGINRDGYYRNGSEDLEVAMLKDFISTKNHNASNYARKHKLRKGQVKKLLQKGLRKAPWLNCDYLEAITDDKIN